MSLRLGDTAPDFTQESTGGTINFHEWLGNSWGILFSHPKDFTPVCTTELGEVARLKSEWDKRDIKVIGLSVDNLDDHEQWSADIEETQGVGVNFPILADKDRKVSQLYDMIHPNMDETFTVRSVFIIAPDKKIRLIITYPQTAGRNFQEILRTIDSMQLTDQFKVATDFVALAPPVPSVLNQFRYLLQADSEEFASRRCISRFLSCWQSSSVNG